MVTVPPRAGVRCQQERGARSSARSSGHDWPARARQSVLRAGRLQSRSKSWDQSVSGENLSSGLVDLTQTHFSLKGNVFAQLQEKKNKSVPSGGRLAERPRADPHALRPLHDPAGDSGGLVLR